MTKIILSTTETIPQREIAEIIGIARGSTVRARNVGRDITAVFKNIVGGELSEYTKLQADAREQALQRLVADAEAHNADAEVGIRITNSMITNFAAEIAAFGTSVKLK